MNKRFGMLITEPFYYSLCESGLRVGLLSYLALAQAVFFAPAGIRLVQIGVILKRSV